MQVSMGQEGPGYMPWSSGTEVWVGWCYPYPRPVQVRPCTAGTHCSWLEQGATELWLVGFQSPSTK